MAEIKDGAMIAASPLDAVLDNPEKINALDVDKLDRLWEMRKEWKQLAARDVFYEAFARAQGNLEPVQKTAENHHTHSRYALLEKIEKMLLPIITAEGFSYSVSPRQSSHDGMTTYSMLLRHVSGYSETHEMDLPADAGGPKDKVNKNPVQALGSSYSYGCRYLVTNVWGIRTTIDDDGNAAGRLAPGETAITDAAAAEIGRLLDQLGASAESRQKFIDYFQINEISELPATRYNDAVRMLEGKIKYSYQLAELENWADDIGCTAEMLKEFRLRRAGDLLPSQYLKAMEFVQAKADAAKEC